MKKAVLVFLLNMYGGRDSDAQNLARFVQEIKDSLKLSISPNTSYIEHLTTLMNPYLEKENNKELMCIAFQMPEMHQIYFVFETILIATQKALPSANKFGKNLNQIGGFDISKIITNYDATKFHAVSCYLIDQLFNFKIATRSSTEILSKLLRIKDVDVQAKLSAKVYWKMVELEGMLNSFPQKKIFHYNTIG